MWFKYFYYCCPINTVVENNEYTLEEYKDHIKNTESKEIQYCYDQHSFIKKI